MLSIMTLSIRSLKAVVAVVVLAAFLPQCVPSPSQPAPESVETGPVIPRAPRSQRATFRVAAIQFISEFGNPKGNIARLIQLITQAAKHGAKVVVLPETCVTGYASFDLKTVWGVEGRSLPLGKKGVSPVGVAEDSNGPSVSALTDLAGQLRIYLTIPFVEVDTGSGRYFNTTILVGPDGKNLLHYQKLNPWPPGEIGWATKCDRGHQYIDTPYGRLGLLTCFDILFEQPPMKAASVETLLYSIAWADPKIIEWFDKGLSAAAKANGFNIVAANWTVPPTPDWRGYGQTEIIADDGTVLAKVKNDLADEIIYADLPMGN